MPGTTPPRHRAHSRRRPSRGRPWALVALVAVAAVVIAGVSVAALRLTSTSADATPSAQAKAASLDKNVAFTVTSTAPADAATNVPSDSTITVQFSTDLSPSSPTPTLSPAVAGTWQQTAPDTLVFQASGPFVPSTTETVTIPGGDAGVQSASGKTLAAPVTFHFTVAAGSTLRLQQLLAQLGYLPLAFTSSAPLTSPQAMALPQPGAFAWRWTMPSALESLWTEGSDNTITHGAIMTFQDQNGLKTDGLAGPAVWQALLANAAAGKANTVPYTYAYVTESQPETLTIYSNGAVAYSTPANTGVAAAPTEHGTFPVYLRYKVTTMSGTNPDGSHYSDPGIPWVSYFNGGDALHGFVRSSYGFPQSVGCVELPPANAAVVYPLTPIGTLVTVA